MKNKKLIAAVVSAAVLFAGGAAYVNDYYRADHKAIESFTEEMNVTVVEADGMIVCQPERADTGIIFYPGGKVECESYLPLMQACAEKGIVSILVEMPFNLAVLDVNAADGVQELYTKIDSWYIGGHSLGGSMAASYLKNHTENYAGLILLGAYSTMDLSEENMKVLSIYGSEDKILDKENYDENLKNLPKDYEEIIIDGGCHSYFGMYGEQDGDGEATITNEEQLQITAEHIVEFVGK